MDSQKGRYVPPHLRGKEHSRKWNATPQYGTPDGLYSPLSTRSAPTAAYEAVAQESPSRYSLRSSSLPPLPLVVLDMNGTLAHRQFAWQSAEPTPRPYLGSFVAYVVAGESIDAIQGHIEQWQQSDSERALHGGAAAPLHGTDSWPLARTASVASRISDARVDNRVEPAPTSATLFRSLVWSSCLTKNLELMVRAIFTPAQARQLLRIYGRDTLVPHQWIAHKAKSTKDLEIVWEALGVSANGKREVPETEKRVVAQYRLDNPDSAHVSQHEALESIRTNTLSGVGYFGQNNTIAFDDSPEKTRLQPFNNALVPEFDLERADAFKAWRNASRLSLQRGPPSPPVPAEIDNVHLQAVGVLAHARWQRNISAWIRSGGLGFFAGMKHPGVNVKEPLESSDADIDEHIHATEPRLDTPVEEKTQHFWAQEGRRALKVAGIACEIDSYHHI